MNRILRTFSWLSSHGNPGDSRLIALDEKMTEFYRGAAVRQCYHELSAAGNGNWSAQPFQREVLARTKPGDRVVEFNCGNGYACELFMARGADYAGVDVAVDTLDITENRRRHLISCQAYQTPFESESADLVVSFYSLEHMVWPERYLEEMLRVLRPGGHIALAFPDYVTRIERVMPSVILGWTPGGMRMKLRCGRWLDAVLHAFQRRFAYIPRMARARKAIYEGRRPLFLVNLEPACLESDYATDSDAVYFAGEEEISQFLASRGCRIVLRSADVFDANGVSQSAESFGNGFVLAAKT